MWKLWHIQYFYDDPQIDIKNIPQSGAITLPFKTRKWESFIGKGHLTFKLSPLSLYIWVFGHSCQSFSPNFIINITLKLLLSFCFVSHGNRLIDLFFLLNYIKPGGQIISKHVFSISFPNFGIFFLWEPLGTIIRQAACEPHKMLRQNRKILINFHVLTLRKRITSNLYEVTCTPCLSPIMNGFCDKWGAGHVILFTMAEINECYLFSPPEIGSPVIYRMSNPIGLQIKSNRSILNRGQKPAVPMGFPLAISLKFALNGTHFFSNRALINYPWWVITHWWNSPSQIWRFSHDSCRAKIFQVPLATLISFPLHHYYYKVV